MAKGLKDAEVPQDVYLREEEPLAGDELTAAKAAVSKLLAKPLASYELFAGTLDALGGVTDPVTKRPTPIITVADYLDRVRGKSALDMPFDGCDEEMAKEIEGFLEADGIEIKLDLATNKIYIAFHMETIEATQQSDAPAETGPRAVLVRTLASLDLTTRQAAICKEVGAETVGDVLSLFNEMPYADQESLFPVLNSLGIVFLVKGGKCEPVFGGQTDARSTVEAADGSEAAAAAGEAGQDVGTVDAYGDEVAGEADTGCGESAEGKSPEAAHSDTVSDTAGPTLNKLHDLKAMALQVKEARETWEADKAKASRSRKRYLKLAEDYEEGGVNADQLDLLTDLHCKPSKPAEKPVAASKPAEPTQEAAPGTAFNVEAWEAARKIIDDKYADMPITVLIQHGFPEKVAQTLAEEHQITTIRQVQELAAKNAQYHRTWYAYLKGFGQGKAQKFDDAHDKLLALRQRDIDAMAAKFPGAKEYTADSSR